jgi:hypothetical protein
MMPVPTNIRYFASILLSVSFLAGPSAAETQFTCVFEMECSGVDNPCTQIEPLVMNLLERENIWGLHGPDGEVIVFVPIESETDGVFTLVANDFDPDASANSMMSLFEGGQAILTTHGEFLTPGVITQVGTCQTEASQ